MKQHAKKAGIVVMALSLFFSFSLIGHAQSVKTVKLNEVDHLETSGEESSLSDIPFIPSGYTATTIFALSMAIEQVNNPRASLSLQRNINLAIAKWGEEQDQLKKQQQLAAEKRKRLLASKAKKAGAGAKKKSRKEKKKGHHDETKVATVQSPEDSSKVEDEKKEKEEKEKEKESADKEAKKNKEKEEKKKEKEDKKKEKEEKEKHKKDDDDHEGPPEPKEGKDGRD